MDTNQLFTVLTILNEVRSSSWNTVLQIVECIKNDEVKVIKSTWEDYRKNLTLGYSSPDLSNISTWSTYDRECIDLAFKPKHDKIICDVKIYNGESFGGHRTDLRFTAKIELPHKFIDTLNDTISYKFDTHLDYSYDEYLEAKKNLWITKKRSEILSGKNSK